jgi:hypothetical protein
VLRRNTSYLSNRVLVKCPDWQTDDDLRPRKCNGKSPEEAAPTRDRIIRINHYFSGKTVLIRKKSCNLTGFPSPGNLEQFTGNPQGETLPGARCCLKNEFAGKWGLKWIFLETGDI